MPVSGVRPFAVCSALCAALAISILPVTSSFAASPIANCGSDKIRAVEGSVRDLGKCLTRLATTGETGDYELCIDAADIELEADFGVAEAKAATKAYTCHGDAAALGLLGPDSGFLDFVGANVLDATPVPDKCVKKAASAAAKGAGKFLKCYRKASRRWDPARLLDCTNKAGSKFRQKWQKSTKPVSCEIADRSEASRDLLAWVRSIGDGLLVGSSFFSPPLDGAFTTSPSLTVQGGLFGASEPATMTVNGVSVLPLAPDGTFSVDIPMDADAVLNPVVIEMVTLDGREISERATVIAGDGVNTGVLASGETAQSSIGMRFSDAGLDQVEPIVASLAGGAFDISALLQGGGPVLDDECVVDSALGCLYNADVSITDVGFSGFELALDAQTGGTRVDVSINDFFVAIDLTVRDQVAVEFSCALEITASEATISADFTMSPDALLPSKVDVNQIGDPTIVLGGFESEFISGICNDPILGGIIQGIVGSDLEPLVSDGFRDSLGDPDGAGPADSAIAGGIQDALAGIELAGPIGESIGVVLEADFEDIRTDDDGLTFEVDGSMTLSEPAPGGVTFDGSYAIFDPFPNFGPTTPVAGEPYGLSLALSSSIFNQLLKAQTEAGLLSTDISELGELSLTAALFAALVPDFSSLPGTTPLVIEVRPTIAPFVTGNPGPSGELLELVMGGLQIAVVAPSLDLRAVEVLLDIHVGVDLTFGPDGIAFSIGIPAVEDIDLFVSGNDLGVDPETIASVLPELLPLALPSLADAFAGIPLPSFLGLEVFPVEISQIGGFLGVFLDLGLSPEADLITNVEVTDLSSADFKTDGAGDVNEWRHKMQNAADGDSIAVQLQGMLGADACCTTGDETANATAAYRVSFSVVSDEDWEVFLSHSILGAFSILDEKVALEDAGGSASSSVVSASYSVDGAAAVDFSFTPSPASLTHNLGGGEGDSDVEFSGSNSGLIVGNGNADIVVEFSFNLSAFSNSNAFFPAAGGDEVAIRLGRSDAIENGFTAGAYPSGDGSLASRDARLDGHAASIQFTVTP